MIWTYRQGAGVRSEVSELISPSLHSILIKDLDICTKPGETITNKIYKPVW